MLRMKKLLYSFIFTVKIVEKKEWKGMARDILSYICKASKWKCDIEFVNHIIAENSMKKS